MPRGELRASIECSVRARGVGVIVDRGMTCFGRLTRSVFKALIRIAPAWVQHGEPGKRREVHKSRSLRIFERCRLSAVVADGHN